MTISGTCTCGKALLVPADSAGKRGSCPACGQPLVIPAAATRQAATFVCVARGVVRRSWQSAGALARGYWGLRARLGKRVHRLCLDAAVTLLLLVSFGLLAGSGDQPATPDAQDRREAAEEARTARENRAKDVKVAIRRAHVLHRNGRREEALAEYRRLLAGAPAEAKQDMMLMGRVLDAAASENEDEARRLLEELLAGGKEPYVQAEAGLALLREVRQERVRQENEMRQQEAELAEKQRAKDRQRAHGQAAQAERERQLAEEQQKRAEALRRALAHPSFERAARLLREADDQYERDGERGGRPWQSWIASTRSWTRRLPVLASQGS